MKRRSLLRALGVLAAAVSPLTAGAQTPASAPIGTWRGAMQGFGDLILTITGIKPNGKLEGQWSFSGPNYTFVFGDALSRDTRPETGTAEMVGGQLVVNAPQGGVYKFTPGEHQLRGTFSRGPVTGTLILDKVH